MQLSSEEGLPKTAVKAWDLKDFFHFSHSPCKTGSKVLRSVEQSTEHVEEFSMSVAFFYMNNVGVCTCRHLVV